MVASTVWLNEKLTVRSSGEVTFIVYLKPLTAGMLMVSNSLKLKGLASGLENSMKSVSKWTRSM